MTVLQLQVGLNNKFVACNCLFSIASPVGLVCYSLVLSVYITMAFIGLLVYFIAYF